MPWRWGAKKGYKRGFWGRELPLICGYIYRSVAYRKGLQGPPNAGINFSICFGVFACQSKILGVTVSI